MSQYDNAVACGSVNTHSGTKHRDVLSNDEATRTDNSRRGSVLWEWQREDMLAGLNQKLT